MSLAVDLHKHVVKVPAPMPKTPHPAHPLTTNVSRKKWPEPVPPKSHGLVTNVDPAFERQILDVAQRQREPDVHHDHQADHFGRGVEVAERVG